MRFGKVAICISGLMRTGILAHPAFHNFFSHLNADVFYHTWDSDDLDIDTVNNLYKPVEYRIDKPIRVESNQPHPMGSFGNMLFSIMMANELKKQYEIENDFRYDLVIKTRFDLVFRPGFRFPEYSHFPRTIYSLTGSNGYVHTDYEHHGINDVIFWGDSPSMDIATNTYMFYKHKALVANNDILLGIKQDPREIYFSPGQMIHYRGVRRNLNFHKYTEQHFGAIPWREDVSHLNPLTEYDKIHERYCRL